MNCRAICICILVTLTLFMRGGGGAGKCQVSGPWLTVPYSNQTRKVATTTEDKYAAFQLLKGTISPGQTCQKEVSVKRRYTLPAVKFLFFSPLIYEMYQNLYSRRLYFSAVQLCRCVRFNIHISYIFVLRTDTEYFTNDATPMRIKQPIILSNWIVQHSQDYIQAKQT